MPEVQPNLVTKTKFAEICGVTAMSISKASHPNVGRVVVDKASKKVDLNHPINQKYQSANNHQRGGQQKKSEQVDDINILTTEIHKLTLDQIKKRRLAAQTLKEELRNAEHRGKLVDRELIGKIFGEMEAIDKKQLRNVAKRATPKILSVLEIDESKSGLLEEIIDIEIWEVIVQKKDKLFSFLESLEVEE